MLCAIGKGTDNTDAIADPSPTGCPDAIVDRGASIRVPLRPGRLRSRMIDRPVTLSTGPISGVLDRFAAPCGDHRCEHEVHVAAGEVLDVRLDLLQRRQARGQQLVADVLDRGRLQKRARA